MKILLVAINAKYIHSNLAVHTLRAYAQKHVHRRELEIEIAEYTINQQKDDILRDIYEKAAFMELLILVNRLSLTGPLPTEPDNSVCNHHVDDILSYINQNISSPLTLSELSKEFFLSESYICRIFKSATGTTINKYITARRISIAKSLLSDGVSVMTAYEKSGFTDYSAFFKAFTKAVGISPKKYARYSS